MQYYIIGAILITGIILATVLFIRSRIYHKVDDYEVWKVNIINRNIAAELSKVKSLNLEGETKEQFESWKQQWELILSRELATVEELLYDAENATERFRFTKAKAHLSKIDNVLTDVERKLDAILTQLNELLHTDTENRSQVDHLTPEIASLRKQLIQNRFQYEHADVRFEDDFNELDNQLLHYEEVVANGNYADAKEILAEITDKFVSLKAEFEAFPELYRLCKQALPSKLDDLLKGFLEMKESGYQVEHLHVEQEVKDFRARLMDCVISLETESNHDVEEIAENISERIQEMYDALEEEAVAKIYIASKLASYKLALENVQVHFLNTRTEVDSLKRTYHFEDDDLEKYLSLEKMINQLKISLDKLSKASSNGSKAHTALREELEEGFRKLEEIEEEHTLFRDSIQSLRKDEMEARKELDGVIDEINQTHRLLRSSNVPGIPNFIWSVLDEAEEENQRVLDVLSKHPLDIQAVQNAISAAKKAVLHATEQTNTMLEQAYLTEQVIQYSNRYRTTYPVLAGKLLESERLFRAAEYELALELAAKAVEEVEAGALKKIERMQQIAQ